jgi:chromosome segregation protein
LRLVRLELKGFKSFRDKTVLEFPDKFMGVVGPNGSGKSNITEAICFVLGKSRGLRAANLQELIFNGGVGGEPSAKAVVAITLEDDSGIKHKVTRIVDRDGSSTYKLDDKRTTRQNIMEIVGDSEYNIILQDDITKVVEMKPKDRRKIIDDLCGIGVYDEKRDKALRELEKVEERISQTHIILGEKQGYMGELKKERDQALNYTKIRDELRSSRATLLYKDVQSLERRDEKIGELTEETKKGLQEGATKIADIRGDIQKRSDRLREISAEMLRLEDERRGTKITETRGEILRFEDRKGLLSKQFQALHDEEREKRDSVEILENQEKQGASALQECEAKHSSLSREIESESKRTVDPTIESEVDSVKSAIYEARSKISALKELNSKRASQLASMHMERGDLEGKVKVGSSEEQGKLKDIEKAQMEHDHSMADYKRFEAEYSQASGAILEAQQKLEETRLLLTRKQSELATIMRTSGGFAQAVKAVVNLKKVIPGIHGPVSQLGEVADERYSLALQVAAGGRLQHVVVNTVADAAKCIEYLRQKKIGRCTFLPLDKINVRVEATAPKEAIGFARDFIRYSDKFGKVFEYVFGDTIIVKDIEAAQAIGIGAWRMVTLDGDLMELTGAMTGGHIGERFEITFTNTDELEHEIAALESAVTQRQGEYDEMLASSKRLDNTLQMLRERIRASKEGLDASSLQKNITSERRNTVRDRLNQVIESIANLEREIGEGQLEATQLEKTSSAQEKTLKDLTERRGSVVETRLDGLKDGLRDIEVAKTKLTEKIAFVRQSAAELKARMREIASTKEIIQGEIDSLAEQVKKLQERLGDLERTHESAGGAIGKLMDERGSIEVEVTGLGAKIGEIEHGMESSKNQMNEHIIEKAKISIQLEERRREYGKYDGVALLEKSVKDLTDAADKLEQQLTSFGSVNMRAIETFDVIKKEYDDITQKLETLKKERQSIFDFMDKIESKKRDVFMEAFDKVKANFERIYAQLADGKGTLTLDNPMNVSESGLIITASPGGKKVMSLDAMSGGEKVLTSSAFLLGLQQYKPAYFYVVDELDAALDKRNSIKLAEMLAHSSSQFLMVTHNHSMLKYMDSAIGVSMVKGASQIVGVRFKDGMVQIGDARQPLQQEPETDDTTGENKPEPPQDGQTAS